MLTQWTHCPQARKNFGKLCSNSGLPLLLCCCDSFRYSVSTVFWPNPSSPPFPTCNPTIKITSTSLAYAPNLTFPIRSVIFSCLLSQWMTDDENLTPNSVSKDWIKRSLDAARARLWYSAFVLDLEITDFFLSPLGDKVLAKNDTSIRSGTPIIRIQNPNQHHKRLEKW